MMIATYTNYRVAYCARQGLDLAFRTAYRGGCVMGFALVSIGLLSINLNNLALMFLILIYKRLMGYGDFAGSEVHYY
jgi:Na+/H+-translocating membrane pyrophosphatase